MKLSIMKITTLAGLFAALAATSAQAQWTLIEDWEGFEPGTYTRDDAANPLPYPAPSNGGVGQIDIIAGIEGTGGNNAAWPWYGVVEANAGDVWHHIPINPIEPNTQSTIFYRVWVSGYVNSFITAFSKVDGAEEPNGTALWGNQSGLYRFPGSEPLRMDARNGGAYVPSNPDFLYDLATWYKVWFYIDNSFAADETQAGVGGYEIYIQGPNDAAPVLLSFGGETTATFLDFRNQAFTSIKSFMMWQSGTAGTDIWLIDDIYQTPGKVISEPNTDVVEGWCGMDLVGGDVDTGDFMGWIYVGDLSGAGWVYSYSLGGFVYVSACPGDSGAWVYVLN
jgi:hypothetical protein